MDKLRIRSYNVGFGDAILISVPDSTEEGEPLLRHILIDVGSVKEKKVDRVRGEEGDRKGTLHFEPVIQDIQKILNGKPLDLYIMTHEHMDHVKGLYYGAKELEPPLELSADYVWLTASAETGYYDRFTNAKKKHLEMLKEFEQIEKFTMALQAVGEPLPPGIESILLNNNPRSTKKCVDYLKTLSPEHTTYIYRGCDLSGSHPFREATFDIWAPEQDTSVYYGWFRPMALGFSFGGGDGSKESDAPSAMKEPVAPENVDPVGFKKLVDSLRHGYVGNLLAIDKAANNTSIVFCLNWRGWKLLFSGDAEVRSWKTMNKEEVIKPIDFFKISHHGSLNGVPTPEIMDAMFSGNQGCDRKPKALLSTYPGVYNDVPDDTTTELLNKRGVQVQSLQEEKELGDYLDIEFAAP
jgi:beta-lactamase superfamily II metal-dependent hydrolase